MLDYEDKVYIVFGKSVLIYVDQVYIVFGKIAQKFAFEIRIENVSVVERRGRKPQAASRDSWCGEERVSCLILHGGRYEWAPRHVLRPLSVHK